MAVLSRDAIPTPPPGAISWALESSGVARLHEAGWLGAGVGIGLLDSGVATRHPALIGKVCASASVAPNGRLAVTADIDDETGHGTHIAAILVGDTHEGQRFGIAPEAQLVVARVLEHGDVIERILAGLDWMLTQAIKVLCLPFGIRSSSPVLDPLLEALRENDALIVAPIGNDGIGQSRIPGRSDAVLSVGAHDDQFALACDSGSLNDGPYDCVKPDLIAPGAAIRACAPDGGLQTLSGTSMACAHVAGVGALLRQAVPEATVDQVTRCLQLSAKPLDESQSHRGRHGYLDAVRALSRLRSLVGEASEPRAEPRGLRRSWCDSRLQRLLRDSHDEAWLKSVLVFADREAAEVALDSATRRLRAEPRIRCKPLLNGRIQIVLAPVKIHRQLLAAPALQVANAVDVDWV